MGQLRSKHAAALQRRDHVRKLFNAQSNRKCSTKLNDSHFQEFDSKRQKHIFDNGPSGLESN